MRQSWDAIACVNRLEERAQKVLDRSKNTQVVEHVLLRQESEFT